MGGDLELGHRLIARLEETGDYGLIAQAAGEPEPGELPGLAADCARLLSGGTLAEIRAALEADARPTGAGRRAQGVLR